jgi:hypothetical protein
MIVGLFDLHIYENMLIFCYFCIFIIFLLFSYCSENFQFNGILVYSFLLAIRLSHPCCIAILELCVDKHH